MKISSLPAGDRFSYRGRHENTLNLGRLPDGGVQVQLICSWSGAEIVAILCQDEVKQIYDFLTLYAGKNGRFERPRNGEPNLMFGDADQNFEISRDVMGEPYEEGLRFYLLNGPLSIYEMVGSDDFKRLHQWFADAAGQEKD